MDKNDRDLAYVIREWKRRYREAGGNTNSVEFKRALKAFVDGKLRS